MSIDNATPEQWDRAFNMGAPKEWDNVSKPKHYNNGTIEAIDAIKASMSEKEYCGYLKGNVLKYLWRYDYKGKPVEDLRKCQWYLKRLLEEQTDESN